MNNRTILLTGASRGIGKEVCDKLKNEKYYVISPRRQELDLSDRRSVQQYIQRNKNLHIDAIINNAGINIPQFVDEIDIENCYKHFETNLIAPIILIGGLISTMKKQKWGRIVNISSIFGLVARKKQVLYTATKHGINGVTKALALELGPYNILVNSVSPGFTDTDLTRKNSDQKNALLAQGIPMGRFAAPHEIAEVVCFLISDKNTYINGANIIVDGGFTCQ
ncbi:MAG: SDR family oxidoreductase [Bacteroidota bacterium]